MIVAPILFFLVALGAQPTATPITVTGRPWAPFISPMGEPFRARSTSDDTLAAWFQRADLNHDGQLTLEEMVADADRFFRTLDTNHDGLIDPDEINHYEWEVAPEIQVNARTRRPPGAPAAALLPSDEDQDSREGRRREDEQADSNLVRSGTLQGAARYGLLNMPEPVTSADADFDRTISFDEFRRAAVERFQLLDSGHLGRLTLQQLRLLRQQLQGAATRRHHGHQDVDTRVGNPLPRQP